jgi:predicted amidophosphoribosyltransferase
MSTPIWGSGYMVCASCGASLKADERFCSSCGSPASAALPSPAGLEYMCSACGTPAIAGDAFCANCGQPVRPANATSVHDQKVSAAMLEPAASTCPACGGVVRVQDSYCQVCGRFLAPHQSMGAERQPSPTQVAAPVQEAQVRPSPTFAPPASPAAVGGAPASGSALGVTRIVAATEVLIPEAGAAVAMASEAAPAQVPIPSVTTLVAEQRQWICPACEVVLTEGERFCRSCGRLVKPAPRV